MKRLYRYYKTAFLLFIAPLLFLCGNGLAAETYDIDLVHSSVVFRIKHLGISYVHGRFNGTTGSLVIDESDDKNNEIKVIVKSDSIDTYNPDRDKHLKSADFLDIEKHPEIIFESIYFIKKDDNLYDVKGELSLHGVTKIITVEAEHTGSGEDMWGGFRTGFEASFKVSRSEFGIKSLPGAVGDLIKMTVSVEAVLQK